MSRWEGGDRWAPERFTWRAAGGGSAPPGVSASTTDSGNKVIVPLPAGFLSTNQSIVNPALFAVEVDAPSVDATGNPITVTRTRRAGYRADVVGADLHVWMMQSIPAAATAVRINAQAGAITNGASVSGAFTATATNLSDHNQVVVGHLIGFVDAAGNLGVDHSVMSGAFWVEAYAWHESGIACVKFDVTGTAAGGGGLTRTSYAIIETRSRYRDDQIITLAQWTKNGNGGIGVYSSAQINPADFQDGEVTVTMTAFARVGGVTVSRAQTWIACMNAGGSYVERVRFCDNVAGNDSWDGTSATFVSGLIGPKLTLNAAMNAAGSVNGGATAFSIPIVRLVGSGNPASPRVYPLAVNSGSGNAIPSATHTWLTVEPAPGFTGADTQIANYGTITGILTRVRRMRFRNVWWDIANAAGAGGTSSSALVTPNVTLYPVASNPEAVWFDNVETYHHLGRLGQTAEGASGSVVASLYGKLHGIFFTRYITRDMARRGFQCSGLSMVRNARFERIFKDVVKGPDCMVATVWRENATPIEFLPVNTITGTPQAGDTITGVYSTGSETVASYLSLTASTGNVTLTPGGNSYTFKADDSKQCRRVTVTGVTGSFSAGQSATLGGTTSVVIGRVEGNDLYLRTISSVTNGQSIVTATGSATMSSNALAECLRFLPSGARGRAGPPHPDGLQVQDFVNQEYAITPISGTFQVGETVNATGASGVVVSQTGNRLRTSGTNQWNLVATGATITGATSGATATYQGQRRFVDNDRNVLLYCILGENIDGQPLFSENGTRGIAMINICIVGTLGEGSLQTQTSSIPDYSLVHVTHPNKRMAARAVNDMSGEGRVPTSHRYCVAEDFSVDAFPQGGTSAVDVWQPGSDIFGCHALLVTPGFSALDTGITRGDALWTDGSGVLQDYDPNAITFQPGPSSPVRNKVPAGQREVRYDLFGNERPNDGTACAGAVEEWSI
jgi:hypothetical protein